MMTRATLLPSIVIAEIPPRRGRNAAARGHFRLPVVIILIALTVAGCRGGASSARDEDDAGAPAAAAVTMAVTAAKATVAPMRNEIRLLGTTVALRHITLRAPAAGRVVGLRIESGDRVRRGEVVAHVINREVEAAESGLAIAQRLDPADAADMADSVKRYAHGAGIAVTAPEDAVVAQRLVSSGQIVADLDPLADFIDPRSIYVEAAVPIDDLASIKPGMDAVVTSPLRPGTEFPARVAALPPSLSQGGSTAPVRVEFVGRRRLEQAGAPVELRVTTVFVPDAIVIPAAALFQDAATGGYYVFVARSDGRAHRQPLTVGIRTTDRVQVIAGLRPGDLAITSGGYALSDGLRVQVAVAQD
jgi:multidrug efflux pump subunit AcrA (membrane-fusion protein)